MIGSGYYTRLAAALFTAALMVGAILYPDAGRKAVERASVAAASIEKTPAAARACALGEPAFSGPFAPIEDVLSVSPLAGALYPHQHAIRRDGVSTALHKRSRPGAGRHRRHRARY
jgi:hypothetical protein